MQPRQSENHHRSNLPALNALVPTRSGSPVGLETTVGASLAADLFVGASSRSVRIENISRDLSRQAGAADTAKREDLRCQSSRAWWRVDGKHDSIDETAGSGDQAMATVGVFNEALNPALQGLLSTQVDVGPILQNVIEQTGAQNIALRLQVSDRSPGAWKTQSSLKPQDPLQEYSLGLQPKVVCGLHDQVSQHILSALGIDDLMATADAFTSESENDGEVETACESVESEPVSTSACERKNRVQAYQGTASSLQTSGLLRPSDLLRDPECLTFGSQFFDNLAAVADDVVLTNYSSPVGNDVARVDVIDATRLFAEPQVCGILTHRMVVTDLSIGEHQASGQLDHWCSRAVEFTGANCNLLEETRPESAHVTLVGFESQDGSNAGRRFHELWHQHCVWTPVRESVRWFVGSLLLAQQDGNLNQAINAVSEQFAMGLTSDGLTSDGLPSNGRASDGLPRDGLPRERIQRQTLCGAWVPRRTVKQPVDIHRVVLQLPWNDSSLTGSFLIMTPIHTGCPGESFGHGICASAAVRTPRFWARVSEFQLVVGSLGLDPAVQTGNAIVLAGTHGTASHLRGIFANDVREAFDATARLLKSVEWVVQPRDFVQSKRRGSRPATALRLDPAMLVYATEFSRWDGATKETDVVRSHRIDKSTLQVQTPFVSESTTGWIDQVVAVELTERVLAGPVFRDGNENFLSGSPRYRVTCDSRQGSSGPGRIKVAALDDRLLRSWAFQMRFGRQPMKKVMGHAEEVARLVPIDIGIHGAGLSEASLGQKTCGFKTMSDQAAKERLCEPTTVMRPVESAVTMQAATSFFFRHRARSAWLTEQVSNVVWPHDAQFVSHHFISCESVVETHAELGVFEVARVPDTHVFDASAEWHVTPGAKTQYENRFVVLCVGCTHACTVAHVPQYLNRAAWCRNVSPLLAKAISRVNVAEDFFPPLVSFELPRLVMSVLLSGKGASFGCGRMVSGQQHGLPEFATKGHQSTAEINELRFGVRGMLAQSEGRKVLLAQPVLDCPTRVLIRRLRAADSLRSFSDPLRNYLRANWSLIELFSASENLATAPADAGTRFLVMTDKRSLGHLWRRCGVQVVSQVVVDIGRVVGVIRDDEGTNKFLCDNRLTDQLMHQDVLLPRKATVSLAASSSPSVVGALSAEVEDVDACCSVRFSSLVKRAAVSDASGRKGEGITWVPESPRSLDELKPVPFPLGDIENTVVGNNVDCASAAVVVQADVRSSPMTFNRPLKLNDEIARKLDSAVVIDSAEMLTSLNLSETCRHQTCTKASADRAA